MLRRKWTIGAGVLAGLLSSTVGALADQPQPWQMDFQQAATPVMALTASAMQGESGSQLRAWVDYFRDLGVHDFYRRGEFAPMAAELFGLSYFSGQNVAISSVPTTITSTDSGAPRRV